MTPISKALTAQVCAGVATVATVALLPSMRHSPLIFLAGLQGVLAAGAGLALRLPRWWIPIHLGFVPLAVTAQRLDVPPWLWLAGFAVLLLTFWRTDTSRVPLYLSNSATARCVGELIPATPCAVIDLGCGTGSLLCRLAKCRPDCRFVGIEHAPLTWLIAWLRSRGLPNVEIRRGDIWRADFSPYQLAYAFLSPIPMPRLWAKAQGEMPPDALLVSNSFAIPEVTPERVLAVADRRQTQLYCYRPGANGGRSISRLN